jgi:hypothetical protein
VELTASKTKYPRRLWIGLGVSLAALVLSQTVTVVALVQRLPSAIATEGMARYEQRLVEPRKALPRSGLIGYISDPPNGQEVTQGLYDRRYHSAQYHLAPLVVADSLEPDIILGNFFSRKAMEKAVAEHNLVLLRDFGNGVFILAKGAR